MQKRVQIMRLKRGHGIQSIEFLTNELNKETKRLHSAGLIG